MFLRKYMSGLNKASRISKKCNDVTKSQAKLGLQAKHETWPSTGGKSQPAYMYIAQYVNILYSCRYIDNTVYRNNEYIITSNNYKASSIAGKCQIKKIMTYKSHGYETFSVLKILFVSVSHTGNPQKDKLMSLLNYPTRWQKLRG